MDVGQELSHFEKCRTQRRGQMASEPKVHVESTVRLCPKPTGAERGLIA